MNRSVEGEIGRREEIMAALARLQAVDPAQLSDNRPRVHAIVTNLIEGVMSPAKVVEFGTTIDGFGFWYLPYTINQLSGPTVDIPNFMNSQQPVTNADEAEAYLVRLAQVEGALDGALANVREAVSKGAIPPDFVVEKSLGVVESFVEPSAEQNAIYLSFVERLETAGVEGDYAERARAIIADEGHTCLPAHWRFPGRDPRLGASRRRHLALAGRRRVVQGDDSPYD